MFKYYISLICQANSQLIIYWMFDTNKQHSSLEHSTFQRFSQLYLIALSIIALSILGSQLLVQRHLVNQLSDAKVVNIAGRQRMLSQRITKELLLLDRTSKPTHVDSILLSLASNFAQWEKAHLALQHGDQILDIPGTKSTEVIRQFQKLNPNFQEIAIQIERIIHLLNNSKKINSTKISSHVSKVLEKEPVFLSQMDAIVNQLSKEAQMKVKDLRSKEWLLFVLGLGIIAAEILLLFRPAAQRIRLTIRELVMSRERASELLNRSAILYKEKEQSLRELKALNFAVDQAVLFASAKIDGRVIHLSNKLIELLHVKASEIKGELAELLSTKEGEQEYIKTIIKRSRSSIWSGEVRITTRKQQTHWLELSIVPVNRSGILEDLLLIASDITSRKIAQQEIDQLKEMQFEESMRQQKLRSSYIVVAQEEERKRIAREMHDGIGQMLTALKFNLQAVNLNKPEKAKTQLEKINDLAAIVIRGVRVATFNLTPPELSDYGIGPALSKLASELSKMTGSNIFFENRTQVEQRFDIIIETNLYRIAQEAVNNAIKYANAGYILITLSTSKEILSIVIDDNGKGFDLESIAQKPSSDGSGMGLAFMKERSNFINGRLFIHSQKGQGTRVTLNIPLQAMSQQEEEKTSE